jgi:hypothetical protein
VLKNIESEEINAKNLDIFAAEGISKPAGTLFDPLLTVQRKPDDFQALEPNY